MLPAAFQEHGLVLRVVSKHELPEFAVRAREPLMSGCCARLCQAASACVVGMFPYLLSLHTLQMISHRVPS